MLENYGVDRNGIIFQQERGGAFVYDEQYVMDRYAAAPVAEMSHLRLGFLVGAIGRVPESLLDVGYGQGDFLKAALKIVPDVSGYDIPPAYPVPGVAMAEDLYGRAYDVVTFFDSLEHFDDIYEIRALRARHVLISLPWCHYFSDEWFRAWKHRRPGEHLWHFNPNSLGAFMNELGFETLTMTNVEDTIRKSDGDWKNILTGVFRKRD